ncbi:hypothetical protein Tco_1480375 [Tanacetum coccineum]
MVGALLSDTVKNPKLNVNSTSPVLSTRSYPTIDPSSRLAPALQSMLSKHVPKRQFRIGKNGLAFVQGEVPTKMEDPELFTLPCRLGNSKPLDTLADLG